MHMPHSVCEEGNAVVEMRVLLDMLALLWLVFPQQAAHPLACVHAAIPRTSG
jgi:hypothetical protein